MNTLYIKTKNSPCINAVIISATANVDIYKWLLYMPITEYQCKDAEYIGTVNLYIDSTYIRDVLINSNNHDELMKKIKNISGDNAVIVFKSIEYEFWMNTFKNHRIRTIQMWLIESLLEQAVGRARLLRFDCTVNVFAIFPIDQSNPM